MDGIHDLGGKHGFGKVEREADEPVFHERWEAAVFAISAVGPKSGAWNNSDRFRHGVERIDPVAYLSHTYYGRWLGGMETLLVEAGVVTTDDVTARAVALGAATDDLIAARPVQNPDPFAPAGGRPASRPVSRAPGFAIGDAVLTTSEVKAGHTRLPAYARNKVGRIHACHDGWVYPDSNAHGQGEDPQYLYTVVFTGATLWGPHADPSLNVYVDLFEPYLARSDTA